MMDLQLSLQTLRVKVKRQETNRLGAAAASCLRRFVRLYRKYSPNQPRDPRGQWTDAGSTEDDGPREEYASGNEYRSPKVIEYRSRERTGDIRIDSVTSKLENRMSDVADRLGFGEGAVYGSEFHKSFADEVRALGEPFLEAEQSWVSPFERVVYGTVGSVRTDVTLRSSSGEILAVWDLKTGSAELSPSRIRTIRRVLGIDDDTSLIQLHLRRGTTNKEMMIEWSTKEALMDEDVIVVLPRLLADGEWQKAIDQARYLCPLVLSDVPIEAGIPIGGMLNGASVVFKIDAIELERLKLTPGRDVAHAFSTTCRGSLENVAAGLIAILSYAAACGGRGYLPGSGSFFPLPNVHLNAHIDGLLAGGFGLKAEWNERYPDRLPTKPARLVIWSGEID